MPLKACPTILPAELINPIVQFATEWARSNIRPSPSKSAVSHWCKLLEEWRNDPSLPLYVRKSSHHRGKEIKHASGRMLIPTDNSPAHWVYTLACNEQTPSIENIKEMIFDNRIPVALALKTAERSVAKYACLLTHDFNVNTQGWKLAHISPIGLRTRQPITDLSIERLQNHFYDFMSPANMFVVPLALAGLGEINQVIEAIQRGNEALTGAQIG